MHKLILVICLLAVFSAKAQSKEEAVIRTMLENQRQAWNRGDLQGFMEPYWKSDSLMFIGKNGITYGWENTLKNYQRSYPGNEAMGTLVFDIIHVKRLSVMYFSVTGKWNLLRKIGDLSGHFTLLVKKIGKDWVIVSDHSS